MTAPVWEDGHGLRVRKTTSSECYFLDVQSDLIPAMEPFMELPEAKAIWYSEVKGWLIPTSVFESLKPFLTHFHDLFGKPEQKRERDSAGLDYARKVEERKDRATVRILTFQEVRLLALLYLGTEDLSHRNSIDRDFNEELLHGLLVLDRFSHSPRGPHMSKSPQQRTSDNLDTLFFEDALFREMCNEYASIRDEGSVQRGDLLKLAYSDHPADISVYDNSLTNRYIPLERSQEADNWILPDQFKVPTPFPVMWWEGLFESGRIVHPNFDELAESMEYISEPELPENVRQWVVRLSGPAYGFTAALRFSWTDRTYHIYFVNILNLDEKITYEQVIQAIESQNTIYDAIDDTTICAIIG